MPERQETTNISSTKHTGSLEEGLEHPRRDTRGTEGCTSPAFCTSKLTEMHQKDGCKAFEKFTLLMEEATDILRQQRRHSRASSDIGALSRGPSLPRSKLPAMWNVFLVPVVAVEVWGRCRGSVTNTNCDGACSTLKQFRYEIAGLSDAVCSLLLQQALVVKKWKVAN